MAASNTRFTQNRLGQSKNPIDSDHGIYRYEGRSSSRLAAAPWLLWLVYLSAAPHPRDQQGQSNA